MKTGYFSANNLAEKSKQLLGSLPLKRSLPASGFDPTRAALIILDMQKYFMDQESQAFVPSASAVLPGILRIVKSYRESI